MRSLGQQALSVRTNSRRTLLAAAVEKLPTVPASSQRLVSVIEDAPQILASQMRDGELAAGGSCFDHDEQHLEGGNCLHGMWLLSREL
jgi:hypothetical protein